MAIQTEKGFIIPEYTDIPDIPGVIKSNAENTERLIAEIEKCIANFKVGPWQISIADEEPEGNNYIWFAPYGDTQEVVLQSVDYNGDETKLHVDMDGDLNTADNTAVSDEDGTKVILFE